MGNKIIFIFALCFIFSCTNQSSEPEVPVTPKENTENTENTISPKNAERKFTDTIEHQKPAPIKGKRVIYESCAVYAGATDYAFRDKDDELILVRVSNFHEEKEGPQAIVPDNMLESGDDIEGPPGANPNLVGKGFILVYDELNEKVLKVLIDNE